MLKFTKQWKIVIISCFWMLKIKNFVVFFLKKTKKVFQSSSLYTTCWIYNFVSTTVDIIFWDFLLLLQTTSSPVHLSAIRKRPKQGTRLLYQIYFSPQVTRILVINNERSIHKVPHWLPNELKIRILGN